MPDHTKGNDEMSHDVGRLGWLGTGRMGSAMARRLIDAGNPVTVWNRTAAKTEPLAAAGADVAERLADLGTADIVFIMVTAPADLEQVTTGENGLLSGASLPKVVVDCSTVDVAASAHTRAALAARGIEFLAAPVSGNPHVVAEGEAVIAASGPRETFDRVDPYLRQIARDAVWVADAEQARLVKLCHNLYLGMIVQALSEVTSLAEKAGVEREAFLRFLNGTVVSTPWVRKRTPDLVAADWTPTFTTELLRKDFDLGLALARSAEVPMPMAAGVHQLIQAAIGHGHRDDDFLSLYEAQAASAGMTIR